MFETVAFYLFAFLTIAMFLVTVTTKNALYALSSLSAGMIFISAFFFLLDASFMGVVQLIVYTGAVMALYAFGMMFFDSLSDVKEEVAYPKATFLLSGAIALILVLIFVAPIIGVQAPSYYSPNAEISNAANVGLVLFTKYLVPFEVAAVMLLVAMIGGIILAGKKMNGDFIKELEKSQDKHHTDYIHTKDSK